MVAWESEGLDLMLTLLLICGEDLCQDPFTLWVVVYHLYKDRFECSSDICSFYGFSKETFAPLGLGFPISQSSEASMKSTRLPLNGSTKPLRPKSLNSQGHSRSQVLIPITLPAIDARYTFQ